MLIIIVGVAAGILGAVLGIGGGVVMLPATQYLMNYNTATSIGTTLFAIMFTALSGAWGHYKQGNVKLEWGIKLGSGGLVGVILGSYIFKEYLSYQEHLLSLMLALLFAFMTIRMLKDVLQAWRNKGSMPPQITFRAPQWTMPLVGMVIGCLTGILGLGGGFLMVPAMIWLYGASPYQAVGTTLLSIFPITAVGAFVKLSQGFVVLPTALLMGAGTVLGVRLGVPATRLISPLVFKLIFTVLFLQLTINYLLRSFS